LSKGVRALEETMTRFPIRPLALPLAVALAAWLPAAGARAAAEAEAPRITAEEVIKLAEKGEVVIIDTRSKDTYDSEHAEGARSVPLNELEGRLGELPKDKLIAAYCT
jgi:hypothetical protein